MSEDKKVPKVLAEPAAESQDVAANRLPVLDSAELFAGGHEVWIEHHGELYRLQLTKAGKLILTK